MRNIYRVHTVTAADVAYDDIGRYWDEATFATYPEAREAFDRCCSTHPTIHEDLTPDAEYFSKLPLLVIMSFANTTYKWAEGASQGYLEQGIGVIDKKTVYPIEHEVKVNYQGAI